MLGTKKYGSKNLKPIMKDMGVWDTNQREKLYAKFRHYLKGMRNEKLRSKDRREDDLERNFDQSLQIHIPETIPVVLIQKEEKQNDSGD